MRTVLFGNQEIVISCLEVLTKKSVSLLNVFTSPAATSNAGLVWSKKLKQRAEIYDVPVETIKDVNARDFVAWLRGLDIDVIFSVFWDQLFREEFLEVPKTGCINLHGSLLPKYRGPSPLYAALLNGDKETGVTLHYVDGEVDHGDIIAQDTVPLYEHDDISTLRKRAMECGARLFAMTLDDILSGKVNRVPQDDSLASYCNKVSDIDRLIDWTRDAWSIERQVRTFGGSPKASFTFLNGKKVYVLKAVVVAEGAAIPGHIYESTHGKGVVVGTGKGKVSLFKIFDDRGMNIFTDNKISSDILHNAKFFSNSR